MRIKEDVVDKYLGWYKEKKDILKKYRPGCHGKFKITVTESGSRIVWSLLENKSGWWAIMCFYDSLIPRVDFYDRHVFDRYRDRFLKTLDNKIKIVEKFLFRDNARGIMFIDENQQFTKRIKDGVCFGDLEHDGKVIYYKTFIPDSLIDREGQSDLLNPKYINYYVNNRREDI